MQMVVQAKNSHWVLSRLQQLECIERALTVILASNSHFLRVIIPMSYLPPLAYVCNTTLQCGRLRTQRAKKVVSDTLGLVDFAIRLVFFVLNLPDGQVLFFGEIQITEGLLPILPIKKGFGASSNDLWASTCYLQIARIAGCKTDFLCTLGLCVPLG